MFSFSLVPQQQQQQIQQPPPYHIAKAFTKKSKQDLLIYDIYRNNYQHSQDESHTQQINTKTTTKASGEADITASDSNAFCDKINANVNDNNMNDGDNIHSQFNVTSKNQSNDITAQPKRTSNNSNPTTSSSSPFSSISSTTNNTTVTATAAATASMPWLFGKHEISTVVRI